MKAKGIINPRTIDDRRLLVLYSTYHPYRFDGRGETALRGGLCFFQQGNDDLKRHTDGGRNRENGDKYFWTLFFHRFPNASTPEEEGVAICVSRRSEDTARVRP